ncbi:hypothetical protein NQ314_000757, partial [Rhamnusium bicolor]
FNFFFSASALECYSCTGPECEKEIKTLEKRQCGKSAPPPAGYQYGCLKLSYKDRATQKTMISRKCVTTEVKDGEANFHCPVTEGDPINCPVCLTDLCNSASRINFSLLAVTGVILAFVAPKFL